MEDRSTLKNIVNTESFAEYTRNGDTLVWNTDDTDVYYKGDTDRQLPISAKVTYTLDGRTAPSASFWQERPPRAHHRPDQP